MDALLGDINERKEVYPPFEEYNTRSVEPRRKTAILSYYCYNSNLNKFSCLLCSKSYKHQPGYLHALNSHIKMSHSGQLQKTLEALDNAPPQPASVPMEENTVRKSHPMRSPFELPEPEWIPNKDSSLCMVCQDDFSLFKRRHHCRRCGRLCCSNCTEKKLPLPRMSLLDPVRHCDACAKVTSQENYFYNKDLKTLIGGASIHLDLGSGNEPVIHQCHLSIDHQQLIVEKNGRGNSLSIPMHSITATVVTTTDSNDHTFWVKYARKEDVEEKSLRVPMTSDAPISMIQFVSALQRAVLMMQEARAAGDTKSS